MLSKPRVLYLVGASGSNASEVRRSALTTLELDPTRRILSALDEEELADSVGVQWIHVHWVEAGAEPLGSIIVGCRSRRRPGLGDLRFLTELVAELAVGLGRIERSDAVLRACSISLAQAHRARSSRSEDRGVRLRPRERSVLELYADGLSTRQIADLLVLSRHTIRSHVRNALRTLGVHSREEAVTMVRADELARYM